MKLKNISFILLAIILISCSIGNDNDVPQVVRSEWHLKNVSGGIDGVNNDFSYNVVVWTFNETQESLTVMNNNTDDTKEDGLDAGTYTYSLLDDGNISYLLIDDVEFGSLTLSNQQLIIDQNEKSSGTGADGYVYTFQLVEIIE